MKTIPLRLYALTLATLMGCAGLPGKQTLRMDDYEVTYAQRGTGQPAVIFEAGFASSMGNWKPVFKPVSEFTTAFAYDRKGIFDSRRVDNASTARDIVPSMVDAVVPGTEIAVDMLHTVGTAHKPMSRDGAVIVEDLRRMLASLNIPPPYVLVGHSLGGMYMELYARTYPQEIAGLVLVDPRRADFTAKCKAIPQAKHCDIPGWLLSILPEPVVAEYHGAEATAELMAKANSLPDVPIVVLTAYNGNKVFSTDQKKLWLESHEELVREVPHGEHIVLKETSHFIQKDRPQVVIDAIRSVIRQSKVRNQTGINYATHINSE